MERIDLNFEGLLVEKHSEDFIVTPAEEGALFNIS